MREFFVAAALVSFLAVVAGFQVLEALLSAGARLCGWLADAAENLVEDDDVA